MKRNSVRNSCLLLAALAIAACDDVPSEHEQVLIDREARAALAVARTLPTVASITVEPAGAVDAAAQLRLNAARDAWRAAVDTGAEPDHPDRVALRALAAPALAARGEPAIAAVQDSLLRWVEVATAWQRRTQLPDASAPLHAARLELEAAQRVISADPAGSAVHTVLAADLLLETTPRQLARHYAAAAERALAAVPETGDPSDKDRERLRRAARLLQGARDALADDEDLIALRRAFYAARLAGAR